MTDYSKFPWDILTTDEIAELVIASERLHDDDFVKACVEEIKKRKPQHEEEE